MRTKELQTDVYMVTEHIKDKKTKVSFKAVLMHVVVDALVITSVLSPATMSFAATTDTTSYDASATISVNYESDLDSYIYNIKQITGIIKSMQSKGLVNNDILIKLADELIKLNDAVASSGTEASVEVIQAVKDADAEVLKVIKTEENADGLVRVKSALATVKRKMGIVSSEASEVKVTTVTTEIINTKLEGTKVVSPTSFKDVKKGSDYNTAVKTLAKAGCLGGYADGTFKPKKDITNAKFLCILMRSIEKSLPRATKGSDTNNTVLNKAFKIGIVKANELMPTDYTKVITKENLALWISRAIEYKSGKDIKQLDNISNLISDYAKIEGSKYQDAVKDLYSLGILTTTKFGADSKVSRGNAVNIILKAADKKYRKDMSKVKIPSDSTSTSAKTLRYNDKNRGLAHIGDTWVDKNGKKTKLTGIRVGDVEIPGFGQGIDLYSGLVYGNSTLKVGDIGDIWNGDMTYMGQELISAKSHDGIIFTFWREQWVALSSYEAEIAYKLSTDGVKDGTYAKGTHFMKYYEGEGWCWVGPVF